MAVTEQEQRIIRYNDAFNETLAELLREDPDIFIAGEDVGRYGGVFQSFAGLNAEFGDERVVDTPIAEQAIIGLGIGAAAVGLRPIVDLMFMDFVMVSMDQIANQAAKMKYMFACNYSLLIYFLLPSNCIHHCQGICQMRHYISDKFYLL